MIDIGGDELRRALRKKDEVYVQRLMITEMREREEVGKIYRDDEAEE